MGILDFIFPKNCVNCKKLGSYLCANCFVFLSFDTRNVCAVCNKPAISGLTHPRCSGKYIIDGVFSSICYKGVVKKLVYKFKYSPHLADLKTLLIDLFYEGIIQKEEFNRVLRIPLRQSADSGPILVPIPLFSSRFKERGYNQAEILAMGLAKKLNLSALNLLKRIKKTHSQVGLLQKERKENISGAFVLNTKYPSAPLPSTTLRTGRASQIQNISVFLVDDVFTTGSTLLEGAKILKKNGVKKVFGLTLASQ